MKKPAITNKTIHPLIKNRWSPRSFDSRPVETEKLQRIFEAARWAPSAFNEQPWRFAVGIKGDNTWKKIFESLAEWNQQWAVNAPVLIMAIGQKSYIKTGKANEVFKYDTGQSVAYLTLQAYEEGLVMHQMGGFSKEKAVELLTIPEGFEPLTVSAIGYQAPPEKLPEEFEKLEHGQRSRISLKELVFADSFGNPSNLAE